MQYWVSMKNRLKKLIFETQLIELNDELTFLF